MALNVSIDLAISQQIDLSSCSISNGLVIFKGLRTVKLSRSLNIGEDLHSKSFSIDCTVPPNFLMF